MMPKAKTRTRDEQLERFRREAQKRFDSGQLSIPDADAAVDAMIRKNIEDYGA